jgi:hyperosmotically inducible protein
MGVPLLSRNIMNITRYAVATATLACLIGGSSVFAQTNSMAAMTATPADNTKSNKVDPSNRSPTADDQKNDKQDLMMTKRIRSSVMADKSLSTYAHNIKIVSVGGNVTLNGVVRSQAEKDSIESKAQAVVQNGSVVNDLKIASAQ